jgi:hypothetical protein
MQTSYGDVSEVHGKYGGEERKPAHFEKMVN